MFFFFTLRKRAAAAPARTDAATVGGRTQAVTRKTRTHAFNANKVAADVLHGGGSVESVPSEVRYYTTEADA